MRFIASLINSNEQIGHVILSAAKNLARHTQILRCAQNDMPIPILLVHVHQWYKMRSILGEKAVV